MPTTTPHALHGEAAERARIIAATARSRYADPTTMTVLLRIAGLLDIAALALDAEQPRPYISVPTEVTEALWKADTLAEEHPQTRFPADFTNYVLQPLTGRPLPFPDPMNPFSPPLALRELNLRNRLTQLHDDTAHQAERLAGWLAQVLLTWRDLMRLADEVRIDNARPCNQH
ncbi:hypothetical protein HHL19_35780 [Streptomyces sp. R302]|uniref:hypothetical protein n=1 Tax=unclassified Streptomyces TaxID=2593676 RepID=UPI00145C84B7|nr:MULTISPECIES: hypothetical protein [unclassified Streptomyces]NML55099.1 hypothetical protein [Streptomyces sp. R301]NML83871.1 hypothetical protein [Streptomyces sp. R302]